MGDEEILGALMRTMKQDVAENGSKPSIVVKIPTEHGDWEVSRTVPLNGETNQKLGLYISVCCGRKIVNNAGSTFPDCPNHPELTIWKPVEDDNASQLTGGEGQSDFAGVRHIENRRLFNLAFGQLKLEEWEQEHLHGCKVCQGVLYVFVQQPKSSTTENPPKASGAA